VLIGVAITAGVAAITSSSEIFLLTSIAGAMLVVLMRVSVLAYRNSLSRQLLDSHDELGKEISTLARHVLLESGSKEDYKSASDPAQVGKYDGAVSASNVRLFLLLGVALLGICISLIALFWQPRGPKYDQPKPDQIVVGYKAAILALRGDAEARNPGWELEVRSKGLELGNLIDMVDERRLYPARRIIQHEYGGWAFLMVASTFDNVEPLVDKNRNQALYANKAIRDFDAALERMRDVIREFKAGVPGAAATYEWMTGSSEDLNRVHYLKAMALAMLARSGAGDPSTVKAELAKIEPQYLMQYPPEANSSLAWALGKVEPGRLRTQ
jgi:nitrogen fixation-related uncharacterized protein